MVVPEDYKESEKFCITLNKKTTKEDLFTVDEHRLEFVKISH